MADRQPGLRLATLCYVRSGGRTLMLYRNRKPNDYHEGKYNGLGGKVEPGESPEQCMKREVQEESGLIPLSWRLNGMITFPTFDGTNDWYVFVFTITEYEGELIDHKESFKRETRYLKRGEIWCFTVNRRWVRDAMVGGNVARFINHACRPNCYSQIIGRDIWIRAGRNIAPGEELTYDYYTDGDKIIQCNCRPGCKRYL